MKKIFSKTKKGAASFYMVAFSTLVLIIIATSFAAVIISEVTRTANDDLSKSAYDSAMAGVEDAKLVVHSYQKCIEENNNEGPCETIRKEIENTSSDSESNGEEGKCDQVGRLLGRFDEKDENGVLIQESKKEVLIQESKIGNNMSQAYTCVKISLPGDYSGALSSGEQFKVIKAKFKNAEIANKVKSVIINWSSGNSDSDLNYDNFTGGKVTFSKDVSMPPTIAVSMIQTGGESFNLDSFTRTIERTTNRGTLFLVPTKEEKLGGQPDTYISAYDENEGANHIEEDGFLKSNDKTAKNLPYAVYCGNASDGYACSTTIDIPRPIGGTRNPDTFYFVVTQPYAGDTYTDFNVLFSCGEEACNEGKDVPEAEKNYAKLDGVQIKIDSTGRANDMYRRVEVRLDGDPNYAFSVMGPLELLNNEGDTSLKKDLTVTCEWNLGVNPDNVTCPQ